MKRRMRQNEGNALPSRIVVFDTETTCDVRDVERKRRVNRLYLGVARSFRLRNGRAIGVEELRFRRGREFLDWLARQLEPRARTWLYGHNVGFDLTAVEFWRALEQGEYRPYLYKSRQKGDEDDPDEARGLLVTQDPPTILDLESCTGLRLTILDTLNFVCKPLAEIASWLGMVKPELPGDQSSEEDWWNRCSADVDVTQALVVRYLKILADEQLGNARYTLPGQSLAAFRHGRMDAELVLGHDEGLRRFERQAYHGHLTRAYFLGRVGARQATLFEDGPPVPRTERPVVLGPAYRLDVNAAYPFAMLGNLYPIAFREVCHGGHIPTVRERMRREALVARVEVESYTDAYPVLVKGKLRWGRGRFWTVLAGPEIAAAIDRGHVRGIERQQWYWADRPFDTFVLKVLEMRGRAKRNDDRLLAHVAKGIAVALHGKFGQRSERWQTLPSRLPAEAWGTWTEYNVGEPEMRSFRAIGNVVQVQEPSAEHADSFPAISAYVCAYHRLHIGRIKADAGLREVLYEDADSLHVTECGYRRLLDSGACHPSEAGKLKVEEVLWQADYYGPKCYVANNKWVVAGVGRKADAEPFGLCHELRFEGLRQTLASRPDDGPRSEDVVYQWPAPTIDGVPSSDGTLDWPVILE